MATNVVPNDYRVHVGYEIITDIANSPENTYYMFLGNHMPVPGGLIQQAFDDTNDMLISAYRNMICAKKISANDASLMVRNIPWVQNTAYAMYDDQDTTSTTDSYYAIVNAGAFSHIWKCLDNNMGANSVVAPDISQISSQDSSYRTSDGYLWKYMASTPVATITKFSTDRFFPLVANSGVTASAVSGAVDVVLISNTGYGYKNWLTGTFAAADLRITGNNFLYAVTGNSVSSTANGFYTGCNIYMATGTATGQFRTIMDYFSNANGNYIVIDSPFLIAPTNGDGYQIYPTVAITGPGRQTINASARALINAVGNTVYRVDMLNRGADYNYIAASVVANSVAAPLYPAIVRGIYGPFEGHGYSSREELGATQISFSVTFANTENNTIPATNQYQQIGIIKGPLFQNVVINFTSLIGTYLGGEKVFTYTARLLQSNVSIVAGSSNVAVANGVLSKQLISGDPILLSATDNSSFWYTTVNVISNDTFMTISTSPSGWACTASQLSLVTVLSGTGMVTSLPGGNTVGISNVTGDFPTGTTMIGVQSGARGTINNVSRNDVLKDFTTFLPLRKLVATSVSGSFQQNEILYMNPVSANIASATSTAALQSLTSNSGVLTFLVSNNVGQFSEDVGATVYGSNSGAVATLTTKYQSEIMFGSSKLLYLENIMPVTRSNTTSDTINIILEL